MKLSHLGLCLLLGLSTQLANAADVVRVKKSIRYSAKSDAPQKVQDECGLQTDIPTFLSKFAKGGVQLVDGDLDQAGRVLELEITRAFAPGGGAWSGAKYVEVTGQLLENGKKIGSFTGARYSTGGLWGGFKGTCSIVGRCGKAIAKDIAEWLKKPSMDAKLGDSR